MEVDLTQDIRITKETPTKDLEGALNGIRSALVDLQDHTRNGVTPEALEKAGKDIAEARKQADEALQEAHAAKEMAKLSARTLPKHRLADMSDELRAFPRNKRNAPDSEHKALFKSEARKAYFDFLTADPDEVRQAIPDEAFPAYQKALRVHDALVIVDQGIRAALGGANGSSAALQAYNEAGGVKSLRMWQTFEDLATPFARAMTTTSAGTGLEWVPTGYTSTLVEDIRQPISVTGQFETVNMPQDPFKLHIQGLPVKSYRLTQGSAISQRNINSLNVTFQTDKHGALCLTSTELEEDSVIALVGIIRSELAWAMSYGLADAIINGQKSTGMDTASVPGTDDVRYSYYGIRYWGNQLAANTRLNANGAATADSLAMLKGMMGRFGNVPDRNFWLTGYVGYAKLLTLRDASGWAVVLTQDKAGSGSTWETGLLGKMFNSPLIVEQDYPENMDANGLITNLGNAQTGLHLVNRKGFRLGIRRGITVEASRERYFDTDQIAFRSTGRFDFRAVQSPSSTYKYVGSLVNL